MFLNLETKTRYVFSTISYSSCYVFYPMLCMLFSCGCGNSILAVIDANHTYAHTKGPSSGIENETSASFKYVMTFSYQDKIRSRLNS